MTVESSVSLQSFAHIDSAVSTLQMSHAGFPLLLRDPARAALFLSVLGVSCSGLFLLMLDFLSLELPLLLHSPSWIELSLLMMDGAVLGLSLSVRSLVRAGFVLLALDINFGLILPLQSFGCMDSVALAIGIMRLGLLMLVFDEITIDFSLFLRSLACTGLLVPVLDGSRLDPPLFPKSSAKVGLVASISSCSGSESFLSAFDSGVPGFLIPLQSFS